MNLDVRNFVHTEMVQGRGVKPELNSTSAL